MKKLNRRDFIKAGALTFTGLGTGACKTDLLGVFNNGFKISLAEWSLHRALYNKEMDNLEFAETARRGFGIEAIEYVNSFFKDKAEDKRYLNELNLRAGDQGVIQNLIMIDGEGALGAPDEKDRMRTVENHKKWVEAAAFLGCHSIRVNAQSEGAYEEQLELCADGARKLTEFADGHGIGVIVENHGGLSSNGQWLAALMRKVDMPGFGTLPDFGNFYEYDRYQGVADMMPFAKAVSAKSHAFDAEGNETGIDYYRMMKIVLDAGYHGYVGVEYEGTELSEQEGIMATKKLLEAVRRRFC